MRRAEKEAERLCQPWESHPVKLTPGTGVLWQRRGHAGSVCQATASEGEEKPAASSPVLGEENHRRYQNGAAVPMSGFTGAETLCPGAGKGSGPAGSLGPELWPTPDKMR